MEMRWRGDERAELVLHASGWGEDTGEEPDGEPTEDGTGEPDTGV